MTHYTPVNRFISALRYLSAQPGLLQLKYTFRTIQARLNHEEFQRMQNLLERFPLDPLLDKQAKFPYKYLGHYAASSFSRSARLDAILNHYQFLAATLGEEVFTTIAHQPVIWEMRCGEDLFTVTLSYPTLAGFEGELSVSLRLNSTLVQMVTFVIVPGTIVGTATEQALLISQVQGAKDSSLMRYATKSLGDITPATVLINAVYGLAVSLGITCAVGISSEQQLGAGPKHYFDYDAFWQQFAGEPTTSKLFLLPIPTPEKPLASIKSNHRARTQRKRDFKQEIRDTVALFFHNMLVEKYYPELSVR
ncbi:DUF535 domain-containing protein [Hymenobacter sp. HMF4947]|uniref:DUF535 domain-containing protein n=1 Tax=Hymenobacter ginkgonis TaxID=2682976 RepID=A0A7K1THU4_9BACT|nr:DUF535 family protein [Hymenobacter ginkgonis]MVN77933.1 DUF535 domain-containing protein [Hymenobacter ginkgonis]